MKHLPVCQVNNIVALNVFAEANFVFKKQKKLFVTNSKIGFRRNFNSLKETMFWQVKFTNTTLNRLGFSFTAGPTFENDCNDLIEVSCNVQMTSLGTLRRFPWNIARLNVLKSSCRRNGRVYWWIGGIK